MKASHVIKNIFTIQLGKPYFEIPKFVIDTLV